MTKRVLTGATTISNWTSIAGALQGMLAFLGARHDRATVMGITGHAFRLAIWTSSEGIADGESAARFDHERALPLYTGLGYSIRRICVSPEDPDYEHRRQEAIRQIRRSVDHGRPVAAYGLQVPDFGVIKGYDDRSEVFYVNTNVSSQYGETLPLPQWPAPGHLQSIDVILPGDRRRVNRRETERAALLFAVQYADQGEPAGPANTAHGFAAFERWLQGYAEPDSLARFGNCRCIQVVQAARRDAAGFLHAIAPTYPLPVQGALESAAAAYRQEALAFSRLANLFPFPNGGETSSPAALAIGAGSLRQALIHEQAAVSAIRDALIRLGPEGFPKTK